LKVASGFSYRHTRLIVLEWMGRGFVYSPKWSWYEVTSKGFIAAERLKVARDQLVEVGLW
jgi:hypothetical protein